jgi:hypothetical protein
MCCLPDNGSGKIRKFGGLHNFYNNTPFPH